MSLTNFWHSLKIAIRCFVFGEHGCIKGENHAGMCICACGRERRNENE